MAEANNIFLVGPMGSGKTAVGRGLAKELGLQFFDSDAQIEQRTGVDIPYIFEKEGEAGFRQREKDIIAELVQLEGVVLATGGGVVMDAENRECLSAKGLVVYLRASVEQQLERTQHTKTRPLLMNDTPEEVLHRLMTVRGPLYEEIADVSVDTGGRRVRTVVTNVRNILEERGLIPLQK